MSAMSLAQHLLQTMSQAVCCCDEHGVVQASSPAARILLQHTPETLHDKPLLELIHPADIEHLEDALVSLTRQHPVPPCTLRLLNGDAFVHAYQTVRVRFTGHEEGSGLLEHILLWLEPAKTPAPTHLQTASVTHNNSLESRAINQAAIDSTAVNNTDDHAASDDFHLVDALTALCVFDAQWRLVYLNETAAQLIDMTVSELMGQSLWQVFPDMQQKRSGLVLKRAMETQKPVYFETLSSDPRLDFAWFGVHALPIDDRLVVKVEDITEHKYQKQQLEAAQDRGEQLFAQRNAILESISDYLFVIDENYRYVYANRVMLELVGETLETLRGRSLWDTAEIPTGHPFRQAYVTTIREQTTQRVRAHTNHPKLVGHVLDITMYPFRGGLIAYSRDVSEFESLRADLARTLAEKEAILNSISDAFTVLDSNWTYVYANSRVLERIPDIVGRNYFKVFPEHRNSVFVHHYQRAFDSQQPVFFEAKTLTTGAWASVRVYPIGDRVTIYATEITEHKQLEHALVESEAKFRTFFEQNDTPHTMSTFTDTAGHDREFVVNAAFARLVEDTAFFDHLNPHSSASIHAAMARVTHPEDLAQQAQYLDEVFAGKRNHYQLEKRYLKRDGDVIWVSVHAAFVRNSEGTLAHGLASIHDITERKRVEQNLQAALQQLEASEAKFRRFFTDSTVPHFMISYTAPDKQYVAIETNTAFKQLFASTVFADIPTRLPANEYQTLAAKLNHDSSEQNPFRASPREKRYYNKDGSHFWCEVSSVIIEDPRSNATMCLSTLQDISARKQAQDALEKALTDKEILLKEVHHRTKNNMQLVSSMLSIQSRRIADHLAQQALFESSRRISLLARVHQALYQTPENGEINVGEQLRQVLEGLTLSLRDAMITIHRDIADVQLDVHQAIPLMLVANELLTNAFKHAFVTPQARDELTVRLLLEGEQVTLEIIDNGVGLPEGTANQDSLGMVIIATLTDQLSADLTLENQPEGGTVARVSFHRRASRMR